MDGMEKPESGRAEIRLHPELMAEVCQALNFDPADFAKRHGEEFTRLYLRTDKMLSHVGQEIVSYLARQVNECLSKAEYALLSYIEYAGRTRRTEGEADFSAAVARYLSARRRAGTEWIYAFEREETKASCAGFYPQMYAMAQAMYFFALETEEFREVAETSGPEAWPAPVQKQKSSIG